MRPGEIKIYYALLEKPESGLTFTNLKKKTGLSAPVLSEYLPKMQKLGVVVKDPETRRYTLAQIYFPLEAFPNEAQKAYKIFAVMLVRTARGISRIKERKAKEEAFREFLRGTFHYLMVLNWKIIGEALAVFAGKEKNIADQNLVTEMSAIINRAFQDWTAPIANTIAIAMLCNLDVIEIGDQFFNEILQETTEQLHDLVQSVKPQS